MTPIPVMDWQMMRDLALLAPHITPTTGNLYFVHATQGNTTNPGTSSVAPLSTWAAAYAKCTANHGDVVVLMPGHTETLSAVTAGITLNIAGVQTVGLGWGYSIPSFTAAGVAIDAISITAPSNRISNIRVIGAALCTALVDLGALADNSTIENCVFEQGATPLAAITAVAGCHRFKILNNKFIGTAAGPDYTLSVEGVCHDWEFSNNLCDYSQSVGLDLAVVSLAANMCLGFLVDNNIAIGVDATFFDFNSSTGATTVAYDGIVCRNLISASTATANIDTLIDAGGAASIENFGTDTPAERGAWIPVTSPA